MKRQIILDTETTGLSPQQGHRIIEIGCLEFINFRFTGNTYHTYINPERDVPAISTQITGLTAEFLKPYPIFTKIVDDFLEFIGDDDLVIHNAAFDMGFLNAELGWAERPLIAKTRAIDTLIMARRKFPGSPASLDALCKRFEIDLSKRDKHGALLDAELLGHVYIELLGGRQKSLDKTFEKGGDTRGDMNQGNSEHITAADSVKDNISIFPKREFAPSPEETEKHHAFIQTIKDAIWNNF